MSEKYQCIKTTAKDLKEIYKNETMDKIFEDFAEALNDYQDFGCESCKAQDKLEDKIADLEHRLMRCIEPKFKVGQEVWVVDNLSEEIYLGEVEFIEAQKYKKENVIWYQVEYFDECSMSGLFEELFTFATEEEAKAKLEEMKNG